MKKLLSAAFILVGALLLWLSLGATSSVPEVAGTPSAGEFKGFYHTLTPPAPQAVSGVCAGCHREGPHGANPRTRAFLNLHVARLKCVSCHGGLDALPELNGKVHLFAGGEPFRPRGTGCRECHRRDSKFFSTVTDGYRRQLLEELEVLEYLEGGR